MNNLRSHTVNGNLDLDPSGQPPVTTGWTEAEVDAITEHGNSQLVTHAEDPPPELPQAELRKAAPRRTRSTTPREGKGK